MVRASYFIHGHLQFIMPTVHVLMKYKCGAAVSNCLYWYSLSVLYERTVHKGTDYMFNRIQVYLPMGVEHCYGKGQQPLLWAGSQVTWRKITLRGIPNHLNYCVIFIVHTSFTNVATGHIIQTSTLLIGDCTYQICMANIWPELYNTNHWNAQYYKLISNFWCLTHVSNIVGSFSVCSMVCFTWIGVSSLVSRSVCLRLTLLSTRPLPPMQAKCSILHTQLSSWGGTHIVWNM